MSDIKQNAPSNTWNPSLPLPQQDWNLFLTWMIEHRSHGTLKDMENAEIVYVVQEANMGGTYWRFLWPKDKLNLDGAWYQTMYDLRDFEEMTDGEKVTIKGVPIKGASRDFIVHKRPKQPFWIELHACVDDSNK